MYAGGVVEAVAAAHSTAALPSAVPRRQAKFQAEFYRQRAEAEVSCTATLAHEVIARTLVLSALAPL